MKQVITFVIILALTLSYATPVHAAEVSPISPCYVNAESVQASLSISSTGTASIRVVCISNKAVTQITATTRIEKKVGNAWIQVDLNNGSNTWTYSTTLSGLSKNYSLQLSETGEYRVVTVFVLTGNTTETITCTGTDTY